MYYAFLGLCGAVFLAAFLQGHMGRSSHPTSPQFSAFRNTYLAVYLVMMGADWLQGPYVYRLYEFYGFSPKDCGLLFIAGFGSSLVFGVLAGAISDRYGRRLACVLYAVSYILSCLTKHSRDFSILMVGRLLGGFATSILWSAFESWMVAAHRARRFPDEDLGSTFNLQITGNGLVAIVAGIVSQRAVDAFEGHPVVPFDLSILLLCVGLVLIISCWDENYGDRSVDASVLVAEGFNSIRRDPAVLLVGIMQALFEGGMYTFVFMWTPMLGRAHTGGGTIPHGLIFASFMMCMSIGGRVHELLRRGGSDEAFIRYVFVTAAAMMAVPIVFPTSEPLVMGAFCVFEACVGVFWPAVMSLRSRYVPEATRSTVINFFRIPTNVVVCAVLAVQGDLSPETVFYFIIAFFCIAAVAAQLLYGRLLADTRIASRKAEAATAAESTNAEANGADSPSLSQTSVGDSNVAQG
eukprot:TRINITY_DN659_c0_g2_i1.p1 TRINITY_DN659_c0_g2~~TRINITY_DN659_c0_g2_i1.p1  ORF type:complete len:465 (-),score=99.02 TRINITY_DN659_c0_g2_i1:548-1942(-)